jgi:hypothetical protein
LAKPLQYIILIIGQGRQWRRRLQDPGPIGQGKRNQIIPVEGRDFHREMLIPVGRQCKLWEKMSHHNRILIDCRGLKNEKRLKANSEQRASELYRGWRRWS